MNTTIRSSILTLALGLLGGCASYGYIRFEPNPLDVSLSQDEGGAPLGRALISVRAIREVEGDGEGHELPIVLRLDNQGSAPVVLLADEVELVDAGLDNLPAPRVERRGSPSGEPFSVAAGETAVFDLVFPFPQDRDPDDYDFQGLNLRWALHSGERTVHVSSSFERMERYYQPYGYGYGFGYGYYPWFGYYGYRGYYCH
jgi:hypothetical protein